MSETLAVACGEVPWERDLLVAIADHAWFANPRRYVDVAGLLADAVAGRLPALVLMSPALRGFAEGPMRKLVAAGPHVVVVLDTIRPPWLADAGFDCRESHELHFPSLLAEMQRVVPNLSHLAPPGPAGRVISFVGVSGGVGVTSLTWIEARRNPAALVVDANVSAPSLGFLSGADALADGQLRAIAGSTGSSVFPLRECLEADALLPLPLAGAAHLGEREAAILLEAATTQFPLTLIDAGALPASAYAQALLERSSHVVVVASATPSGVLRMPAAVAVLRDLGTDLSLVLNGFRATAVGSRQGGEALRGLVERACGVRPVLIADCTREFDAAWISGDWRLASAKVPQLAA